MIKILENFKSGLVFGTGILFMLVVGGLVYATLSWNDVSEVESGNILTAQSWNDMINDLNYLKEQNEILNEQIISLNGLNISELGINQARQVMTGSRLFDTTYTNNTGKPILIIVVAKAGNNAREYIYPIVDGIDLNYAYTSQSEGDASLTFVVPNNATYSVKRSSTEVYLRNNGWSELR